MGLYQRSEVEMEDGYFPYVIKLSGKLLLLCLLFLPSGSMP